MRATVSWRGIKGIFPLLKQECPHVFHHPARLADLAGYRLAIDATLLVQRFHFSDDDHPARHLIGFSRLIHSLRAADIFPIFVFDHLTSRVSAKARETERRREARRLTRARMEVEGKRAWRLRRLVEWLERRTLLSADDKKELHRLLRSWKAARASPVRAERAEESTLSPDSDLIGVVTLHSLVSADDAKSSRGPLEEAFTEIADLVQSSAEPAAPPNEPLSGEESHLLSLANEISHGAINAQRTDRRGALEDVEGSATQGLSAVPDLDWWYEVYEVQTSPVQALAVGLDFLYQHFEQSHSQADTRGAATYRPTPAQAKMDEVERLFYERLPESQRYRIDVPQDLANDVSVDHEGTDHLEGAVKRQAELAKNSPVDELDSAKSPIGRIEGTTREERSSEAMQQQPSKDGALASSDVLLESDIEDVPSLAAVEEKDVLSAASLEAVSFRNKHLQKSYSRSAARLAPTVFDDCATLCSLLQAPVVWTGSGSPHGGARGEAEALAASLVAQGQADAVATEDSDVLLAEVPILRHLTGSKKPLEVVDSKMARKCLFPPKAMRAEIARTPDMDHNPSPPPVGTGADRTADSLQDDSGTMRISETGALTSHNNVLSEDRSDEAARADKLSRYAMLEFALLCGTDYNRTIPGLGPKGALRLLRQHGNIRAILLRSNDGAQSAAHASQIPSNELPAPTTAVRARSKPTPLSQATSSGSANTPKYSPPGGLTWKEYGAELSKARSVFKNPPDGKRALTLAGITAWDGTDDVSTVNRLALSDTTAIPASPPVSLLDRLRGSNASADTTFRAKSVASDASDRGAIVGEAQSAVRDEPINELAQADDSASIDTGIFWADELPNGSRRMNFPPPQYDRAAVGAFLFSRGLGGGASAPEVLASGVSSGTGGDSPGKGSHSDTAASTQPVQFPCHDATAPTTLGATASNGPESLMHGGPSVQTEQGVHRISMRQSDGPDTELVRGRRKRRSSPSLSKWSDEGFGRPLGGEVASRRFAWDV